MSLSRKAYAIWRKRRQSNNTIKTLTEPTQKKEKDPKVDEREFSLKGGNWSLLDLFNCSREVVEIKIKKIKN